ncbi:MFS transporter [Maricaulis sp.]|uniref:MFS transporter n=1 Tax=Maricaulis sp. TaxID=1486257 RepID=UPI003A8F422E
MFSTSQLTDADRDAGLKWYVRNGMFFKIMETLSIGVFLTAYALGLGASNLVIGVLAAIPSLTQLAQLPAVYLVERIASRRFMAVSLTLASRLTLLVAAAAALIHPGPLALLLLVVAFAIRYIFGAIAGCAWNSWVRDFLPPERRGVFSAQRLTWMTIMAAIAALAGGVFVDHWAALTGLPVLYAYSALLVVATISGVLESVAMAQIPEPTPLPLTETADQKAGLFSPLKEKNFRRLVTFLFSWNFASNLAAPFFAVQMLRQLGLDLTTVMVLTALSQGANALVTGTFGSLADRYSNRRVLQFAAPLFIACIFAWTFTSLPERHFFTLPLLVVIHILTGIATAGVTLASGNMANALSPSTGATRHLALCAAFTAIAAGTAPIIGGLYADVLANYEFSLTVNWRAPGGETAIHAFDVTRWDFYFLAATVIGLWSLTRLDQIEEPSQGGQVRMRQELMMGVWRGVQTASSIAGLKAVSDLPIALITERLSRQKKPRTARGKGKAETPEA